MFHVCVLILSYLFLEALSSTAGKGLTSRLSCMLRYLAFCHFPILCRGSGVVIDCIDFLIFAFSFTFFLTFSNLWIK